MLTFFQEPFSHWCVKVQKILDYKKIPYESKRVGYHDKRALMAATGQDYVPALVHDGRTVLWPDAPDFLESLTPSPTLYPGATRGTAKALESWAHWRLEEVVWRYVVPDMAKTFDDDLERWVFEEIQTLKRGPLERMRARRPEFEADLRAHLAIVEEMLAHAPFLQGDAPTLADFAVYGGLMPLWYSGLGIPAEFGKVRAWKERVAAL